MKDAFDPRSFFFSILAKEIEPKKIVQDLQLIAFYSDLHYTEWATLQGGRNMTALAKTRPETPTIRVATVNGQPVIDRNGEAEAMLREVRLEVYNHDPHTLARRVGVSVSTIHSFRSGRTVWPRPTTLFAILEILGFQITIVRR